MNKNTKNEIQKAEKKSKQVLSEIENAIGKNWQITLTSKWGVMESGNNCILWTEESFLGFNKEGSPIGVCFDNIELPLTTQFFIDFAEEGLAQECNDEFDEIRYELAKTLSAYFSAKQLGKSLKTNKGNSARGTKV